MNAHPGQNFHRPNGGISRLNGRTERRKFISMVQELLDALRIDVFIKRMKKDHEKSFVEENSNLQTMPGLSSGKNKSYRRLVK